MVSMIGRVGGELFHPILARTLDVLERGNLLLPKPDLLQEAQLFIQFQGPVTRSQRQTEAQAIVGAWTAGGQIAPVHPEVFDVLNADESMRIIARANGVPLNAIRSKEEVTEIREVRAEQEQQAQLLEQFQQASAGASDLLPALASSGQEGQTAAPAAPAA